MRIRKRPHTSSTDFILYNTDIGTAFPNYASSVSSPTEKDADIYYRQDMSTVMHNLYVRNPSEVEENGGPHLENKTLKIEGRLSHGSDLQHAKTGCTPREVDHALRVPTGSLLVSLCRVLSIAGGSGLTAREAASKIKEGGFAGLNEPSSIPSSVKIAKVLRSSPQFKQTACGKFIMSTRIQSCSSLQKALGNVNNEKSDGMVQQQKAKYQAMIDHRYKGGPLGSFGKKLKQPTSSNAEINTKGEQSDCSMNCWGKSDGRELPSSSQHACLHQIQNPCFKSKNKTIGISSPQVISSLEGEPHREDTLQDQLGAGQKHLHSESNPRPKKRVKARCLMSIMRTNM